MIPDNSKKRLEQLRQEMAFRAQLQQQYDKEMSGKYTRDMPSFQEWLDKRPQNKAKGGSVHPMGINVASDTKAGLSYADMIVDGHKKYESRNSDTLRPYVGKRVAIVRTGEGKAKAIGEVTIGEPKVVNEKQFREMEDEHKVPKGSRFDINTPTKHLYPMHDPVRYEEERDVGHGIVSRKVIHKAEGGSVEDDYRSSHQAPSPEFGAPMHDVTRDMYPKDFYGPSGFHIYADYGEQKDRDAYNKVVRVKGKPNEMVSIHRAIPTKVYKEALKKDSPLKHMIRKGDWVAINKDYAKEHGEGVLLGDYKIASMRVPAKHVWTNADSIHEWGYHPDEVIKKAQGGTVNPFDYENPKHVQNVASIASKHRDFKQIPDAAKHLAGAISQGSYKFIEDPRIQTAIKQAGHNGYYINGKEGKQQIVHKAEGGAVLPIEQIKAQMMNKFKGLSTLQSIGAEEAPSLGVKAYVPTVGRPDNGQMPVGGIDTKQGDLPVGGIDMSTQQAGQQLMPNAPPAPAGMQQGMNQVPQGDKIPTMDGTGMPPAPNSNPNQMGSNILSMTPQGQAMAAMKPQGLAKGGSAKSTADMKAELAAKKSIKDGTSTRIKIDAEGPGGVKGIVVPRHMWEGKTYKGEDGKKVEGMRDVNEARAKVYGSENRDPLTSGQMNSLHKKVLAEHFQKPLEEQTKAEEEALNRLREAKHIGKTANTLDKSEKLDTVNHETDSAGRNYVGFASKGVAGHSLYTSGHGANQKHHVINTCAGQTVGCGGGIDKNGIVDTSRGTCFAPNAESQYVNAAVRRASHEQAKHDPAMSKDWILAHTGSLRNAAENADKKNKVLLFRPNVVDETDVTSRHAIRHLNDQRKANGKPHIIANSYGKTNELHDPENGYYVTHSNVGPKVKKGQEISENIARDKARVRNTILASDNKGDFKNEQGNKTPPKGSYMVTDVKRGSPLSKNMEAHITHAKYWTTGRPHSELTPEEIAQGPEGHYGGDHKPTTEDEAHYGHKTVKGLRFDYQKQHVLHPRLVQVGKNDDGTPHMIPTDSRFKDEEVLNKQVKERYKTKNGKVAGHILMTTPTESTSSIGHQTSFTHHVNDSHIEHAKKNKGEYEIDKPEDQLKASGKEYVAPQAVKFYAEGGQVGGRHPGLSDDDFHAFPEQNYAAQRHLSMRGHDHEPVSKNGLSDTKRKVTMNKDMDTMLLELTRNKKAK